MIKKIIKKRNYIILSIIIILLIFIIHNLLTTKKEYIKTYNYFNETITIKIYSTKNMKKTYKNIEEIYKKYQKYYQDPTTIKDPELIKYAKKAYKQTNGLVDITTNKLIQNIKNNRKYNFTTTIDKINLKDKTTLKNINLDTIIGAYSTTKVEKYLKKENINQYIINEEGNITAGDYYEKGKYPITILDNQGKIITTMYIENQSVVTKQNTSTFKAYMVNPITSKKTNENKMVVVIANDLNTANIIATTLYLLDIEKGKKFIEKYDAQALWYTNGKVITTDKINI